MRQLFVRKGKILVEDVPAPSMQSRNVLVEVERSLISTGTEVATVVLSGASLVDKARSRPEEVKKVLDSIRLRGVKKTFSLVKGKLDEWKALGYSCTGRVVAVGTAVTRFKVGDRVACAGAGLANHAEVVSIPETLTAHVPAGVSADAAAFVTVGAIALQGVRRADARLGETVAVIGLGLIGQITVQLLQAAGCRVIGFDPDPERVTLGRRHGLMAGSHEAATFQREVDSATDGRGADATIITASTDSNEPARQSFQITRKKGRIVVVGAVGMNLPRSPFYEKEQDFLISCSYGPGRYDPDYESRGQDYPVAYVRWTENRNMEAFLELLSAGRIDVSRLSSQTFPIDQADKAYEALSQEESKPMGVLLSYSAGASTRPILSVSKQTGRNGVQGKIRVGLIGVGNFMKSTHIPNLQAMKGRLEISAVCATNGSSALTVGRQVGASEIKTDYRDIISSPSVDAVLIATRHDKHAQMTREALAAGKHVFLEKPLALTSNELSELEDTIRGLSRVPTLMVGFNRRFSPTVSRLNTLLAGRNAPLQILYRVNAGKLPAGHWAIGEEGGGRLRGEACHMFDLFQFLTGSSVSGISVGGVSPSKGLRPDENFSARLEYEDGSVATLVYTADGSAALSKEYVELHWAGTSAIIDDYKSLTVHGRSKQNLTGAQDKGHATALDTFVKAIRAGISFPVPWEQLAETTRISVDLDQMVWGRLPEPR